MNVSQMMRSLLGEASGGDSRAMELKTGQVVRGVVMQVLENNEAIVQINGVQVRAKLEVPLQAGQSAILQVQPDSSGAIVMLKAIEPGAAGLPEDTFKEWAKQLVLPDRKWAVEIVKDLRKEGVILNREVAQQFQLAAAAMPAGADAEQWMQASAAAFKRGLPLTGATVAALQQVMFGRSAHELLDSLQGQLAATAGAADGDSAASEGGSEAKPLPPAAARVQALLAEGAALLRGAAAAAGAPSRVSGAAAGGVGGASAGAMQASLGSGAGQAVPAALPGGTEAAVQAARAALLAAAGGTAQAQATAPEGVNASDTAAPQASRVAGNSPNWIGQMMKWLGVDYELQLSKAFLADSQPQQQTQQTNQATGAQSSQASQTDPALGVRANPSGLATPSSGIAPTADLVDGQAAAAGKTETTQADNQQTSRLADSRQLTERALSAVFTPGGAVADSSGTIDVSKQMQQHESLKSALLSLVASDDIPPAMKETAQQLVQQITGQQLLLTPERNSSVLTHVTMFIPLHNEDGSQTASVHIQTRRGRKGELDASNCRLLFNLSMKTLGDTMVDVHVMDKIVSLNLWNDHPAISTLAESSRLEITESLQQAGYQLSSLRTTPLPKANEQPMETTSSTKIPQPPDLSQFSSTRYKGVDFRI